VTASRRLQPSASRKQRRFANGAAHEPNRPEGAFACSKYQADRGKAHAFRVGSRRGVIGRLIFMFCSRMALWPGDARTARGGVHEIACLETRRRGC
jgi:hypothetical protein